MDATEKGAVFEPIIARHLEEVEKASKLQRKIADLDSFASAQAKGDEKHEKKKTSPSCTLLSTVCNVSHKFWDHSLFKHC